MTEFTNDYRLIFPLWRSPFRGQTTESKFMLDWRQTKDPWIGNGFLDTYFVGELIWMGNGRDCQLEHEEMDFMQKNDATISQLAITESAFTCMLNNIAASEIGHYNLNEERLEQFFNVPGIKFDTTNFAKHIPLF